MVPSVYDILVGRVSSVRLHDVPLVEVLKNPREELAFVVKSISDRLIAGVLLVLCSPAGMRGRRPGQTLVLRTGAVPANGRVGPARQSIHPV